MLENYRKLGEDPIYLNEPLEKLCSSTSIRQAEYTDNSLVNTDVWEWKHNRNYRLTHYMVDKFKNTMSYSEEKFNGSGSDDEMNLSIPVIIIMACLMTFRLTSKDGETEMGFKLDGLIDYFDCLSKLFFHIAGIT